VKRLDELCAAWGLPDRAEQRLAALLALLDRAPDAPTAVTDPCRALDVHLADSLSGLDALRRRSSLGLVVDVGSGAGFPGLPIAVALPRVQVDLLEATQRKCVFLARAIEELEAANARVVCQRAEEWGSAAGRDTYDAALARAVGSLPILVEYAAPLLREGGMLVAWKGRRDPAAERAGAEAALSLGLQPLSVIRVEPFAGAISRHLHLYEKVSPTPAGYPRRPGRARKCPLGT
jgi:16S rRNA (guanine527-N7)-methyltransferase